MAHASTDSEKCSTDPRSKICTPSLVAPRPAVASPRKRPHNDLLQAPNAAIDSGFVIWRNTSMRSVLCFIVVVSMFHSVRGYGQPFSIKIEREATGERVSVMGSASGHFVFEGTTDLGGGNWDLLSMIPASQGSQGWVDAQSAILPSRFYRAQWLSNYLPPWADNFRLID